MNISDCLKEGLLKKERPDIEKAKRSLERAEDKLGLAKRERDAGIFESAVITAYTSMFHSARALLFRDGIVEKSHYAVFVYVKEKYGDRIERRFLNELNSLRLERHSLLYGLEEAMVSKEEAEGIICVASDFLEAAGKIISSPGQ